MQEDEILAVSESDNPDWLHAIKLSDGTSGLVPSNYVTDLEVQEVMIAAYDYETSEENELSLREGESVLVMSKIDEDWWLVRGESGYFGLVPSSYLEKESSMAQEMSGSYSRDLNPSATSGAQTMPVSSNDKASTNQGTKDSNSTSLNYVAQYDYKAQEEDELSISSGDRLQLVSHQDDNWSIVKNGSKSGLVPRSYITEITQSMDRMSPWSEMNASDLKTSSPEVISDSGKFGSKSELSTKAGHAVEQTDASARNKDTNQVEKEETKFTAPIPPPPPLPNATTINRATSQEQHKPIASIPRQDTSNLKSIDVSAQIASQSTAPSISIQHKGNDQVQGAPITNIPPPPPLPNLSTQRIAARSHSIESPKQPSFSQSSSGSTSPKIQELRANFQGTSFSNTFAKSTSSTTPKPSNSNIDMTSPQNKTSTVHPTGNESAKTVLSVSPALKLGLSGKTTTTPVSQYEKTSVKVDASPKLPPKPSVNLNTNTASGTTNPKAVFFKPPQLFSKSSPSLSDKASETATQVISPTKSIAPINKHTEFLSQKPTTSPINKISDHLPQKPTEILIKKNSESLSQKPNVTPVNRASEFLTQKPVVSPSKATSSSSEPKNQTTRSTESLKPTSQVREEKEDPWALKKPTSSPEIAPKPRASLADLAAKYGSQRKVNESVLVDKAPVKPASKVPAKPTALPIKPSVDNPWSKVSITKPVTTNKKATLPPRPSEPLSTLKPKPGNTRLWTDKTGKFQVEAEYVCFEDGKIELLKLNGNTVKVPVDALCDRDVEFVYRKEGLSSEIKKQPTPLANSWLSILLEFGIERKRADEYGQTLERESLVPSQFSDLTRDFLKARGFLESDILLFLKGSAKKKAQKLEDSAEKEIMKQLQSPIHELVPYSSKQSAPVLKDEEVVTFNTSDYKKPGASVKSVALTETVERTRTQTYSVEPTYNRSNSQSGNDKASEYQLRPYQQQPEIAQNHHTRQQPSRGTELISYDESQSYNTYQPNAMQPQYYYNQPPQQPQQHYPPHPQQQQPIPFPPQMAPYQPHMPSYPQPPVMQPQVHHNVVVTRYSTANASSSASRQNAPQQQYNEQQYARPPPQMPYPFPPPPLQHPNSGYYHAPPPPRPPYFYNPFNPYGYPPY